MAAYDALVTAAIAQELRSKLLGGRVQQALQPTSHSVGLEIYAQGARRYLLLSIDPQDARVHLVSERLRRGVDAPSPLVLLLRKHVRGARLTDVTCPAYERILRFRFSHPEYGTSLLIAEIMGRLSNLILVDEVGEIRDSLKRVGPEVNRVRVILPGAPYRPPPPQQKLLPDQVTPARLEAALRAADEEMPLWRALVRTVAGLSPQAARELAARATGDPYASVAAAEASRMVEELEALWAPLRTGAWEPHVVQEGEAILAYAPYRPVHLGPARPVESMSRAIEMYYARKGQADPYAGLRATVAGEIAEARKRLERQRTALQRQMVDPEEAQRWRQAGEWILAFAHEVRPGQDRLVVDTGEGMLQIDLDPQLTAVENAQAYFSRYRKAQRAAEEVPRRLEAVERELAYLDQLALDLEMAGSQPEIAAVREALSAAGYLRRRQGRSAPPPGPIEVTTPEGFTILVGRNSRQNDEITFRVAAPDDLWLHARGVPGAHVIIRSRGRPVPETTLRRAAELAAYYSAARDEPDVLVSVVPRRRVRRQPGGHPGQVTYTGEETIRVRPRP